MLALMAEREQTRTLLRAKVQKIIQKTAFGEDINTISVQNTIQFVKKALYWGWEQSQKTKRKSFIANTCHAAGDVDGGKFRTVQEGSIINTRHYISMTRHIIINAIRNPDVAFIFYIGHRYYLCTR